MYPASIYKVTQRVSSLPVDLLRADDAGRVRADRGARRRQHARRLRQETLHNTFIYTTIYTHGTLDSSLTREDICPGKHHASLWNCNNNVQYTSPGIRAADVPIKGQNIQNQCLGSGSQWSV